MTGKASNDELSHLHGALAKMMRGKLEDGTASAADMGIIRQFLKDNGIESMPGTGGVLDSLAKTLETLKDDEEVYLHS